MDEWCGNATSCPCGCGWAACTIYGMVDLSDCKSCSDDTRKDGEDDGQSEE